tara:strand:- start:2683 stop:3393 length:711 start_codon:yes stop_codon:yes gene_type:complete
MKILTTTWSYDNNFDIKSTTLWQSFIKNNDPKNFIHVHYNRNTFLSLEEDFEQRFGFQYEYILYKIFLLKDFIKNNIDDDIIFCDATDTACLSCIDNIKPREYDVMFSREINQYPSSLGDWGDHAQWNINQINDKVFLNAGLIISTSSNYIKLLTSVFDNILTKDLKSFGGDQGIYTYHYLVNNTPKIVLDNNSSLFLTTFNRNIEHFKKEELPCFIHDNGFDYGSPQFIKNFNLV